MNLCNRCKKEEAKLNRTCCEGCLEKARIRAENNRIEHERNGLCLDCRKPKLAGHVLCELHLSKRRMVSKENVFKLKDIILNHYGNRKCSWPDCEVSDPDMLTLDHIEDNGAIERKEKRRLGVVLFGWLIKQNFPKGYQILCGNHQLKKELMRRRRESLDGEIDARTS